ncbi:MAG: MaoC family dehydratase [Chloroflexi bacterium]|nr:MaoC family dehydratase [Chloroflexota bacterium]
MHQGDSLPSVVKHVTQQEINLYAEASGDFNPIHIDETFAAKTPLGGTIAHGMLILAYASEMMTKAFGKSWLEGGKLSVRFKAAARPQDTITTSGKIDSIEFKEGISYVNCSLECCNQKGEVVITGGAVVKLQ